MCQVSFVDENCIDQQVLLRALEHVEQRLESVRDNAASYLAGTELRDSLLFLQVVRLLVPKHCHCLILSPHTVQYSYRLSPKCAGLQVASPALVQTAPLP